MNNDDWEQFPPIEGNQSDSFVGIVLLFVMIIAVVGFLFMKPSDIANSIQPTQNNCTSKNCD
jgi:hypothetical protein